jgi:hypothetical protein
MRATCSRCKKPFEQKPGPGRPRKQCEVCRAPRPTSVRSAPARPVAESPAGPVALTEAQLRTAGRLDTPKGAMVMHLTRELVAGGHTASGLAALAGRIESLLDSALAGTAGVNDPMDEFTQRRLGKGVAG